MQWTTVTVSSVTNAMRGKRLLEGLGYKVYIQRSHAQTDSGCGYSLLVRGGDAAEHLRKAGIRVLKVTDGEPK